MRPSRRCGPRPPAEHHSTVSAILKPFPPAWRGLPVRCPKSYNLPSDAARAPPVPGFSSPYSSARLSFWQCSLGLMSWRWLWSPGVLLCLPSACDAHSFDAVSLDLPSDVARASLSGIPNSFYAQSLCFMLLCFLCSSSAQPIGPTRPSEGYCALSEASWVLSARYRPLSSD